MDKEDYSSSPAVNQNKDIIVHTASKTKEKKNNRGRQREEEDRGIDI